jgi:hypothetical protein
LVNVKRPHPEDEVADFTAEFQEIRRRAAWLSG